MSSIFESLFKVLLKVVLLIVYCGFLWAVLQFWIDYFTEDLSWDEYLILGFFLTIGTLMTIAPLLVGIEEFRNKRKAKLKFQKHSEDTMR